MKSVFSFQTVFLFLLIGFPICYLYLSWEQLPAEVPLHWGFNGNPNRIGSKNELAFTILLLLVVGLGAYFLLANINRVDPKKSAAVSRSVLQKMGLGILVFLSALSIFMIHTSLVREMKIDKSFYILLGLFFAYLGNSMYSLKPNYFAGVRTPWTLESEVNWRKTHQLTSKLWVAGGAIIALSALIFSMDTIRIFFIMAIIVMVFYPILYSYQLFRATKTV